MNRALTRREILMLAAIVLLACRRQRGQLVTTVNVELDEYVIRVDTAQVPAGRVRFVTTNVGQLEHELIVLRTDLPADQLPYSEAKQTAEEEEAGEVLGEIEPEDLPPGKTAEMTLELPAGHYVLLCNIPTHYRLGMHLDFRVV
ncbi:hypothetical protein OO015_02045 [Thermomicrobium sp. 4228-Ro]|uniref:hypothetical protein n=1 Tax=Thermomicrobium sp. 4228-Ro TaxID=2993937 RepID=UPI0022491F39|nr:hypothetical protein [Thermomicrobium sp. 4228-Ro]MCX2726275.1 hypothetical protein [Thermomicrobium sp. 4228-Ro]